MSIETLYDSVTALESSFQKFQDHQEKRWKDFYDGKFEKPLEEETSYFSTFLRSGKGYETKALTEEGSGKLTLPVAVVDRLQSDLSTLHSLRSLCSQTSISGDHLEILLDQGEASGGWVKESDPREETGLPEFKKHHITLYEMYARPKVSQRLLDDTAIDIQSWIHTRVLEHFSKLESKAFLFGDGEVQPKGILTYPSTEVGKNVFGELQTFLSGKKGIIDNPDLLIETILSLPSKYLSASIWVMGKSALAAIQRLKDTTGRFLWSSDKMSTTLLGYPVVLIDEMPPLVPGKESTSIIFGNLKEAYQIVDHKNMTMMRDPYSSKPYIEFYTTKRVGGDMVDFDAIRCIRAS